MILSPHEQGTPEWKLDRIGKVTGSRADCVTAKSKDGKTEGTTRRNYRVQLVCERLTGEPQESGFQNKAMQDGIALEPEARMRYEAHSGNTVETVGFGYLPSIAAGCSVDGMIGEDGIGEFKCPLPSTHLAYLLAAKLPDEYVPQVTHNLWVTGRAWCDFVSYCPKFPPHLRLFIVRVLRTELPIDAYTAGCMQFLAEVNVLEQQLRKRAA